MTQEHTPQHKPLGPDLGIINQVANLEGIKNIEAQQLDPGFGFSPNTEQSFDSFSELMQALQRIQAGCGTPQDYEMASIAQVRLR